jgi:DNA repair exonuclease SbcCD ATPase subunit
MIKDVEITNWRAYEHRKVEFGPGITFLMGPNGTGKTSILEAVCYALTGEASTVKQRGKLLRDPEQLATVRLTFAVDSQTYLVERSQSHSRADKATLIRLEDQRRLATFHGKVTNQIEQLMGVSANFLQRIVYMAEGDVFRFLRQPPGKALDLQIRRVLGLTQLDEFMGAVDAANKEVRGRMSTVRDLLGRLEGLGISEGADLERRVREIDTRRDQLLTELRSVQEEIAAHRRENENLLRLIPLLDQALPALRKYSDVERPVQETSVLELFARLEQQVAETEDAIEQEKTKLAHIEGEQTAYQQILEVLLPYADRVETLPCPVCSKPMTRSEREQVIQDVQGSMRRITQEAQAHRASLESDSRRHDELRNRMESLRELRNALVHVSFQSVSPQATMTDLQESIRFQRGRFQDHLDVLQQKAKTLEQEIAHLEGEKAEYLTIQRGMQSLGYDSPEDARQALIDLETRYLSLRAASHAAQETLTTQRNTNIEAIYDQVARLWGAFVGRGDWRIQLDSEGMPVVESRQGRTFDLSQFSGGEKTALLVMLHTIIAHHFAKSDFLLIDEPLEHLDPINRRSLIRFLVGAYRRNSFRQAIIATFEESLIRKYMSEEGINVIHV